MKVSSVIFPAGILAVMLFLSGCWEEKNQQPETPHDGAGYFSVREYASDQFETFWGQPFTMEKSIRFNGKTDTVYLDAYNMEWGQILAAFFKTDIGEPGFIGKYRFQDFEDEITQSRIFLYEAIEASLLTRKLQVSADPFSNKIKSVYIETAEKGKTGKLLYIPLKLIQIQEYSVSFPGGKKDLRVEYRFL